MIAIADTGFVVAILSKRDQYHSKAVPVYQQAHQIYLPQTTLTEVAYLLAQEGGSIAVSVFLAQLPSSKIKVIPLQDEDLAKTAVILKQYANSRIDFVDATVMAVAERYELTTVLTLDQRDFRLYRPSHCSHFEILP